MAISNKLNLSNNSWLSCKYTVNVEIIFPDNDVRTLHDSQITGLYMEKDYDNDHLPIMMIDLAISSLDESKINDETIFHVKISQYYLESDDDANEKKSPKIYLDDKFVRIGYGQKLDTNESIEKKIREANGIEDNQIADYDLGSQSTYVLIKKNDLVMSKKIINNVVSDASMQDIVCWMLSDIGCDRKVLMSSFTNTKVYDELLLQPKPFLEQMDFLESEFGYHKEGTYIFIDYDTFYIIRKSGKCTAWRKNDIKNICFCISGAESSDAPSCGIIKQDDIVYVNVGPTDYSLIDSSVIEDQISGSNIILINTTTGESEEVVTDTNSLGETGTFITKMHHGHNPYIASQIKRMKNENSNLWEIKCTNCDISLFTPQRHFSFLTDVTRVSNRLLGTYRVSSLVVSFIKNGATFNTTSTIRVKRTSKD